MLLRRVVLALAALVLLVPAALAQPARPKLPAGSDANDWEAYFDFGVTALRRDVLLADAAFYWSSRLDPTRADALFARWVTFWLRQNDHKRFAAYMKGEPKVLQAPDVMRTDSLRTRALHLNPFVHQGLYLLIIDAMPGYYRHDDGTRGWIAYAQGNVPAALQRFSRALQRNPEKWSHLHFTRASGFVALGAFDSASTELDAYLRILRQRDEKEAPSVYESKALLEYAQSLLHMRRRQAAAAEEALGRALTEDMSFAPAHVAAGNFALSRGQTDAAVRSLTLAVEVDSTNLMAHLALGDALLRQGRHAAAVEHYRRVAHAEPYYAEGLYRYAVALEGAGQRADAVSIYERAVSIGSRYWLNAKNARARLAALK